MPAVSAQQEPVQVSVIIPVYNRETLIRESIVSALGGGGLLREVIAVDDCSTDGTWTVLQSYGDSIRSVRLPQNSGQAEARNAGLDLARGDYIKFLDSDDVLVEGHLEQEIDAARQSNADIVVSGWATWLEDGRLVERGAPRFGSIVDDVLAGRAVPTSAALYRRGGTARWDPAIRKLADWDFFAQSALGARTITTIEGTAYWLRDHPGPRVSRSTMLQNALSHHAILRKFETRLAAEGRLTPPRRLRLAQYYYKELRVFSLFDRERFECALEHILELDPQFAPRDEERQWWMRLAARMIGTRRAVLFHSAAKRMLGRVPS